MGFVCITLEPRGSDTKRFLIILNMIKQMLYSEVPILTGRRGASSTRTIIDVSGTARQYQLLLKNVYPTVNHTLFLFN